MGKYIPIERSMLCLAMGGNTPTVRRDNMAKVKAHNEWFRPVSLGNRKSCPTCKARCVPGTLWAWGEYTRGTWYTVLHFCVQCYPTEVLPRLTAHAAQCHCTFQLCARSGCGPLPAWLTLPA